MPVITAIRTLVGRSFRPSYFIDELILQGMSISHNKFLKLYHTHWRGGFLTARAPLW